MDLQTLKISYLILINMNYIDKLSAWKSSSHHHHHHHHHSSRIRPW